eukprot:9917766-Alexandrium_andersonii.AAC.1
MELGRTRERDRGSSPSGALRDPSRPEELSRSRQRKTGICPLRPCELFPPAFVASRISGVCMRSGPDQRVRSCGF